MKDDANSIPIYSPDNEPYLGRELLHVFDELIVATLDSNAQAIRQSKKGELSQTQKMASVLIPQSTSIMLSTRELIRQGYLFGGHVLLRPFVERVVILTYINYFPKDVSLWQAGWHSNDGAPSLMQMAKKIGEYWETHLTVGPLPGKGWKELIEHLNSLIHAKPDSMIWNLTHDSRGAPIYASSKLVRDPALCDDLCGQCIAWVTILRAMIHAYFPAT